MVFYAVSKDFFFFCFVGGRLGLRGVLLEATPMKDPARGWNSGLTGYLLCHN